MSEITNPSISKAAKDFNNLNIKDTYPGMKRAALLARLILKAERAKKEAQANPVKDEEKVPTGAEIRQAYEEGEYR